MPFSAEDRDWMEGFMKRVVMQTLTSIGLGVDETDNEAITQRQADQLWVRKRRLASESFGRSVVRSIGTGLGVGLTIAILYAATHLTEVLAFATAINGVKP